MVGAETRRQLEGMFLGWEVGVGWGGPLGFSEPAVLLARQRGVQQGSLVACCDA